MKTTLEQSQKQVLSQNQIQSVTILQMSAEELSEHIKEVALENPVAELKESAPEDRQQDLLRKRSMSPWIPAGSIPLPE